MQTFSIINPDPVLAPFIRYYWVLQYDSSVPVSERTLPTGCLQWVFHRGHRLRTEEKGLQPFSFVCGQSLGFEDVVSTGRLDMITVVFRPEATRAFLRIPPRLFFGLDVSVGDVGDTELSDLAGRVADAPDTDSCIRLIEGFLIRRSCGFSEYDVRRIRAVLEKIEAVPGVAVSQLAGVACLSERQFGRVFAEYVGACPKDFLRIVRMQRALSVMQRQPGLPLVQLPEECGFYDQSHMIGEFKKFSGYTPTEYLSVCAPYSDYFSSGQ